MKESGRDMRLGRAMTPLWEEKWAFDPWYDSATFYSSPMMAGFQVHASILNRRREAGRGKRPFGQFVAQLRQGYAGSYVFGPWTALTSYSHTDFSAQSASNRGMSVKHSMMLAGIYSFGMDKIRFGYGRIRENGDYKYTVGYNMGFSKRTNLYIDVYREILESKNNHMNGIAVGMNHSF